MLSKISRELCLKKYPKFPLSWYNDEKDEFEHFFPEVFNGYILTLPSKSFRGNATQMGKELSRLMKGLHYDKLIFLGDTESPWLIQYNDYGPVKKAHEGLMKNGIGKKFNGALKVKLEFIPLFIRHLSWMSRCNAMLPYIHFIDPGQNVLGLICQYGNLHFYTVNKETDFLFKVLMKKSQFVLLKEKVCHERFSRSGAIRRREITY